MLAFLNIFIISIFIIMKKNKLIALIIMASLLTSCDAVSNAFSEENCVATVFYLCVAIAAVIIVVGWIGMGPDDY